MKGLISINPYLNPRTAWWMSMYQKNHIDNLSALARNTYCVLHVHVANISFQAKICTYMTVNIIYYKRYHTEVAKSFDFLMSLFSILLFCNNDLKCLKIVFFLASCCSMVDCGNLVLTDSIACWVLELNAARCQNPKIITKFK